MKLEPILYFLLFPAGLAGLGAAFLLEIRLDTLRKAGLWDGKEEKYGAFFPFNPVAQLQWIFGLMAGRKALPDDRFAIRLARVAQVSLWIWVPSFFFLWGWSAIRTVILGIT